MISVVFVVKRSPFCREVKNGLSKLEFLNERYSTMVRQARVKCLNWGIICVRCKTHPEVYRKSLSLCGEKSTFATRS